MHDDCIGDRTIYTHDCARLWKRKQLAHQLYEMAREAGVLSAHDEAAFHILYSAFLMDRSEQMVSLLKEFRKELQDESDAKQKVEVEGGTLIMEGIDEMPRAMRQQILKRVQQSLDDEAAHASQGDNYDFSDIDDLGEINTPMRIDGSNIVLPDTDNAPPLDSPPG